MLCDVSEDIKEISENDVEINLQDDKTGTTPEKGRVWRWRNNTTGSRQNTEGPVLRATVKPVKRFIPEINSPASANTNPHNQNVVSSSKQVAITSNDDQSTNDMKPKRQLSSNTTSSQNLQSNKKKRVREQWSIEDKNHFFEAVAVHGKDFEAIQKAIAQKHKKRGDESVVKTKDQVRHLFYRTWTTINKLLDHEASVNHNVKGSQELLAVINYGELRKKLGGCILKKKGILKLNELITFGSTSVRVKGKNYRIKTPSCKALKRIHDLEGAAKKSSVIETRRIKLPLRVNLELHPLSMSAWNRVHLLAHNPRLRCNMPLDCQLSYLLSYLNKKWQSLSSKMFTIAQGDSLTTSPTVNSAPIPSTSKVEIHIPPEVSVKSKFQVHEVVTTKTHCIVSYFVHKAGKQLSSTKKKKKEIEISDVLPTTPNELCNSSEDEGGFIDHISDLDEHPINSGYSVTPTEELKDEDFKTVVDTDSDEGTAENVFVLPDLSNDKEMSSHETDVEKVVDSFYQETEISAEQVEDTSLPADTIDSNESISSDIFNYNNFVANNFQDKELKENEKQDLSSDKEDNADKLDLSIIDFKSLSASSTALPECYVPVEQPAMTKEEAAVMEIQEASTFPPQSPQATIEAANATDMAEVELENEMQCDNVATAVEADSPVKAVPLLPIQKFWDNDNVGDITLAELYLLVGKPSIFKLCYHWKELEQEINTVSKETKLTNQRLSTSVTALVQYASLMLSKIQKASSDSNNLSAKENDKISDGKNSSSSSVSVGVQCNIIEKNDTLSHRKSMPLLSNVSKKSHSKALKRSSDGSTSGDINNDFVVPNIPPRRKRNQSAIARKSALSNVEGIPQGGQVRLSDVEFRKQMDAINRRIDLFRTKSRNRSARKPYIVQRAMMPNATSVRKMMTLSIDSMGANRVGFLPITNQSLSNNAEPELEAVGATISSASNSVLKTYNPTEAVWGVSGSNTDDGQSFNTQVSAERSNSDRPSVLALAAEKAGLLFNDNSPGETSNIATTEKHHSGGAATASQLQEADFSISSRDHNALPVDAGRPTSPDNDQPSLIKNDVTLHIRPPTPSVDSLSDLFNFGSGSNNFLTGSVPQDDGETRTDTPVLSMPVLDLPITPQKSMASPIHPWSINCNSRDGLSGFTTLNTPQRILPSDTEDSMDSIIYNITKRPRENDACDDAETNLQLQCLLSENSVDFMTKFRNLMQSPSDVAETNCNEVEANNEVYESNEDG